MGFLDTTWDLGFTARKTQQRAEGDANFMSQYLEGEQGPPTPEQEAKGAVGNADVNAYKQQAERVGTAENMTGKDTKVGGTKPPAFSRDPDAPVPVLGVQGNIQTAPSMFPGADALMGGPFGALGTVEHGAGMANFFKGMAANKAKGPIAKIVDEAKGAVLKPETPFEEATKVKNADGPIPVYHGSGQVFDTIDPNAASPRGPKALNSLGKGAYFTANADEAASYAAHGPTPNTRKVFLDIRKPFDVSESGVPTDAFKEKVLGNLKGFDSSLVEEVRKADTNRGLYNGLKDIFGDDHVNEFMKRLGFDGIKADNHYVAFNADQIINAIGKGKTKPAAQVAVDFDRITTVDDAAQAVDDLATQQAKLNEVDPGAGAGAGNGAGGNGTGAGAGAGGNGGQPLFAVGAKPIPDANAYAASETLGMTPEELAARQRGDGLDVEHMAAYNTMIVQAREHLEQVAEAVDAGYMPEQEVHNALAKFMLVAKSHEKSGTEVAQALRIRGRADVQQAAAFGDSLQDQLQDLHEMVPSGAVLAQMVKTAGANAVIKTAKSASEIGKDMYTSLLYFTMLSNPKTNIVNVLGGSMFTPSWDIGQSFLREKLGSQYVKQGETVGRILAFQQAWNDGIRSVVDSGKNTGWWNTMRSVKDVESVTGTTSPPPITGANVGRYLGHLASEPIPYTPNLAVGNVVDPKTVDLAFRQMFDNTLLGKAVDGLGEIVNWPSAMLRAGDKFAKGVNFDMEARAAAINRGILDPSLRDRAQIEKIVDNALANPTLGIREQADQVAAHNTFTQDLKYGVPQILQHPVAKTFIPFYQTPVNIFKYNLEGTPFAFALGEVRADLKAGGARGEAAMTKIAMGTAFMASVAGLAEGDIIKITGRGPDNPAARAVWLKDNQEYSIRVKNPVDGTYHHIGMQLIEPYGTWFGTAADLVNMSGDIDPDTYGEALTAGIASFGRNFTNKTFMKSSYEFLNIFNVKSYEEAESLEQRLQEFAAKRLTGFIPSGVAGVARGLDPVLHDIRTHGDAWRTMVDRAKSRIPTYSSELPPLLDGIDGEPIVQEAGWSSALLNPFTPKQTHDDPLVKEIVKTKANYVAPSNVLDGVALTPQQHHDMTKYFTQRDYGDGTMRQELEKLFASDGYNFEDREKTVPTTAKNKALQIEILVKSRKAAAKMDLFDKYPDVQQAIYGNKEKKVDELFNPQQPSGSKTMLLGGVPVQVGQ